MSPTPSWVSDAISGVDAVVHAAAKAGLAGAYAEYHRTNVLGSELIIAACRNHGVEKLVYTSSPSVAFGGTDQNGVDELAPYPKRYLRALPAHQSPRRTGGARRQCP